MKEKVTKSSSLPLLLRKRRRAGAQGKTIIIYRINYLTPAFSLLLATVGAYIPLAFLIGMSFLKLTRNKALEESFILTKKGKVLQ